MQRSLLALIAGSGVLAAAFASAVGGPREAGLQRLQGMWSFVQTAEGGEDVCALVAALASVQVESDQVTLVAAQGDTRVAVGTLVIRAGADPKEIDLVLDPDFLGVRDTAKGFPVRGVYALEGERLTLCLAKPGERRPRALAAGPGRYTITLCRPAP